MTEPLVTVGLSFFNCEKTLLDAVKSIFAQTFQDWELILLDGGSSDRSLDVAKTINDPRVRVIGDGSYHTHPAALNRIIDLARGKYIANMDGDDLCSPTRLEKQLELFKRDESIDVVGTGLIYLGESDIPLGYTIPPVSHSEICKEPHRTFRIAHGSIMAKRSWHINNKYDESAVKAEDFNLWLRSYEHSKFANVSEPLYYYRCETSSTFKKRFRCRLTCTKFLFSHYYHKGHLFKAVYYASLQIIKFIIGNFICLFLSKRKYIERRYTPISSEDKIRYADELDKIKKYVS